jgi:DNA-binding NarL/FixJ family response regulator
MKKLTVFMADDHPFIIEAYDNTIKTYENEYEITVLKASNCKEAYETLNNSETPQIDLAFLDVSMPAFEERNVLTGEDVARIIKNKQPQCKIIMLTMLSDSLRILNIIKNINPNGLIIKNDLTFEELKNAFEKILKGDNYYSQTVVKYVSQSASIESSPIDELDRQILYHISRGVKTKNIPMYTSMSLSTIEKRKLHLKDLFKVKGGSDEDLIREARERGFL